MVLSLRVAVFSLAILAQIANVVSAETDKTAVSVSTQTEEGGAAGGGVMNSTGDSGHMDDNNTLPFLLEEMQEVEKMIALQSRKLKILESIRHRVLAGDKIDLEASVRLQQALLDGSAAFDPSLDAAAGITSSEDWKHYLSPVIDLSLNYSIVASVLMVAKVKRMPGQHGTESLIGLVDADGYMHILTKTGEEIFVKHLGHSSAVNCLAFDGTDVKKTIVVTAAVDGSIHVMNMEVVRNASLAAALPVSVTMNTTYSYKLNEILPSEVVAKDGAVLNAGSAHVRSLLVYVKQSVRSFVLLIGDSMGRVTLADLNGDKFDIYNIQPGEPITSMARLGTLVAMAAGHDIHIHIMGRFDLRPKICHSGGNKEMDKLVQISMDMGSNPYLFAQTSDGRLLSFDTKTKSTNENTGKAEVVCALLSALKPSHHDMPMVVGSIVALKSSVMLGRNCHISLYDTSLMRAEQELTWVGDMHPNVTAHQSPDACSLASAEDHEWGLPGAAHIIPRFGTYIDAVFLPSKSERMRAIDALVLVTANVKYDAAATDQERGGRDVCMNGPDMCTSSAATSPGVRSQLHLFATVEKAGVPLENPFGDLWKGVGGWVRIPLFLGVFFLIFLWNGGASLFKKKTKNAGADDKNTSLSPSNSSVYGVDKYRANRNMKNKTMEELKDVGSELERLHKMTAALRSQVPSMHQGHDYDAGFSDHDND